MERNIINHSAFGRNRGPVVVIAAHPDDEVIGAGCQLWRWRDVLIIFVTDGAPRSMTDALENGFTTRADYARARRTESLAALVLAGVKSERIIQLPFADQDASFQLPALIESLADILRRIRPALIVTHAYEGGHPDHDATAFAVHAAARVLVQSGRPAPLLFEMTSYHNCGGLMVTGEFLPRADCPVTGFVLSDREREFKQRLFACFETQRKVLQYFPVQCERFRPAPEYDFTQPPHEGQLYYELFDWGMTGGRWRMLVSESAARLDSACPPRLMESDPAFADLQEQTTR
jgi:N-acetylglucosamine malate deacetylase 2